MRRVRPQADAPAVIADLDAAARRDEDLRREVDVGPAGRREPRRPRNARARSSGPPDGGEEPAARLERSVGERAREDGIDAVALGRQDDEMWPRELPEARANGERAAVAARIPDARRLRRE